MQTSSKDSLGKSSKTRLPVNTVARTAYQTSQLKIKSRTLEIRVNTVSDSTEIRVNTVSLLEIRVNTVSIQEIPLSGQQVPSRQNSSALGHFRHGKVACAACSTAFSIHCRDNKSPLASSGSAGYHALLAAPQSQSSKPK